MTAGNSIAASSSSSSSSLSSSSSSSQTYYDNNIVDAEGKKRKEKQEEKEDIDKIKEKENDNDDNEEKGKENHTDINSSILHINTSSSSLSSSSSKQILYIDVLQHIFSFLTLSEFNSSSQSSHHWLDAAVKAKNLHYPFYVDLALVKPSQVHFHSSFAYYYSISNCIHTMIINLDSLNEDDEFNKISSHLHFPSSLRRLKIAGNIDHSMGSKAFLPLMKAASSSHSTHLEHIKFQFDCDEGIESRYQSCISIVSVYYSFQDLKKMKSLKSLSFDFTHTALFEFTTKQMKLFGSLSSLTELNFDFNLTADGFENLSTNHSLHNLKSFSFYGFNMTGSHIESLLRFPTLTAIHLKSCKYADLSFLSQFNFLQELEIHIDVAVNCDNLVITLKQLPLLQQLTIEHPFFTCNDFNQFMPHLVNLTKLELSNLCSLNSLHFLGNNNNINNNRNIYNNVSPHTSSSLSLSSSPSSLTSLDIRGCPFIPTESFEYLHSLSSLESLTIISCSELISKEDELLIRSLTPGTAEFESHNRKDWPKLKSFRHHDIEPSRFTF